KQIVPFFFFFATLRALTLALSQRERDEQAAFVDSSRRPLYSFSFKHNMKQSYSIIALPGDGIGPEVLAEGLRVLCAAGELFQIDFRIEEIECGGHYYAGHEIEWPAGSFEKCEAADAIILGAVGHE